MDRDFDYVGFDFSQMEGLKSYDLDEEEFRQSLLDSVRDGAITPEQAENSALNRGLDSLVSPCWKGPSVFEFRAWSVEMAVAWLIWRSNRAVQHFYSPYRTQCFEWRAVRNVGAKSGYERERLKAASIADVRAKASHSRRTSLSYNDAVKALLDSLGEGLVSGSGFTSRNDEYKTITADEWATLKLDVGDQGETLLVSLFKDDLVRYHCVTFRPEEILQAWESEGKQGVVDDLHPGNQNALIVEPPLPVEPPVAAPADAVAHRRTRGRKRHWAWDTILRAEAFRLLDHHGDIDPDVDPNWTQARLVDAMLHFCHARWRDAPSESSMRGWVRQYLADFRQQRAAGAN